MHSLKIVYTAAILLIINSLVAVSQFKRCATDEYGKLLEKKDPRLKQGLIAAADKITQSNGSYRLAGIDNTKIYRIPVVVHVIWNAAASNIPDEIIHSQIRILNEDYRRLNADTINTFPIFKPVAGDAMIEFFLAGIDPEGHTSTGIVRKYTPYASFDYEGVDNTVKPLSYWPNNQYLNIWVTTITDGYLGVGPHPDLVYSNIMPDTADGIVIHYLGFGKNSYKYGLGRTTTHEVGHWLGLLHNWGDEYCGNDFIEDTPTQNNGHDDFNISCPKYNSNCNGSITQDMSNNYMDYSPDQCMNIFTKGQVSRMRYVMETNTARKAIQNSPALGTLTVDLASSSIKTLNVYPNPSNELIFFQENIFDNNYPEVVFLDQMGKEVLSYFGDASHNKGYDISSLPNGMYLIKIIAANHLYQTSLSVIR